MAKSVTGSTTALSNATSPPTSFAASAETLATWQEIVQTDSAERIGAMVHQLQVDQAVWLVVQLLAESALATLLTASTRYVILIPSCG